MGLELTSGFEVSVSTIIYLIPPIIGIFWWLFFRDWLSIYLIVVLSWGSYSAITTGAPPEILQNTTNAIILTAIGVVFFLLPSHRPKRRRKKK